MRIILILFFLYAISIRINAQDKEMVRVVDTLSKQSIAFATIVNKNNSFGLYSNELGIFNKALLDDEIVVSCIGYFTKTFKLNESVKRIYLRPKSYAIGEITIKPKRAKKIRLGYYKYNVNPSVYFAYEYGTELAVLIENPTGDEAIFNKIFFAVSKTAQKNFNYDFTSVFKVNLYSVTENNKVGSLINENPLLYKSTVLKKKTVLDISDQSIIMPNNGVFIAIEWVGIINEATNELDRNHDGEPFVGLTYKPVGVIVFKRNLFYNNKWKMYNEEDKQLKSYGIKNHIPQISIVVTQ